MADPVVLGWLLMAGLGAWWFRPPPSRDRRRRSLDRAGDRTGWWGVADSVGVAVLERLPWLAPASPRWLVGAAFAGVAVTPVLGPASLAVTAGLVALGRLVARRSAARRHDRALDELGPIVDLLRIAVSGGLSLGASVAAIGRRVPPARAAGIDQVVHDVDRGSTLDAALERWATRAPTPIGELVGVLRSADRGGVAVAASLERLARDFRRRRRRRAEERARRLPVTMLVPLVCCVLPAFALVTVVPMVAVGLGRLTGST